MLKNATRRGQALVLVTLALFTMAGLMGLAVDFGWAFFVEKQEQAAADAAAVASAREVLKIGGTQGPYSPGNSREVDRNGVQTTVEIANNNKGNPEQCLTLTADSDTLMNNHDIACLYAAQNGFAIANGRQNVTVERENSAPPPTAPGVNSLYWVTVRIAETIPQLFSSILGNTEGLTSSIGTAAIVDAEIIGSLLLINRGGDCIDITGNTDPECGLNFYAGGGGDLRIEGGILIASGANGQLSTSASEDVAAEISGSGDVRSDYTHIRGTGRYIDGTTSNSGGGGGVFTPTPEVNVPETEPKFWDPFYDRGQPPLYDMAGGASPPPMNVYAWPGGSIPGGTVVQPGIHYAYDPLTNGPMQVQLTFGQGDPITFNDATGFNDFIFIGGFRTSAQSEITLAPGRIVAVGVPAGQGTNAIDLSNGNPIFWDGLQLGEQGAGGTAGTVLINAGKDYPGLKAILDASNAPVLGPTIRRGILDDPTLGLDYGGTVIKSGNTQNSYVRLHGLNDLANTFPLYLKPWRSMVYWQDRKNSITKYDPADLASNTAGNIHDDGDPTNGNLLCDGNTSISCPNDDGPLSEVNERIKLTLHAGQSYNIWGVTYQPRGAWTSFQGTPSDVGAIQMITGALRVQGGGELILGQLSRPALTRIVALVH